MKTSRFAKRREVAGKHRSYPAASHRGNVLGHKFSCQFDQCLALCSHAKLALPKGRIKPCTGH